MVTIVLVAMVFIISGYLDHCRHRPAGCTPAQERQRSWRRLRAFIVAVACVVGVYGVVSGRTDPGEVMATLLGAVMGP